MTGTHAIRALAAGGLLCAAAITGAASGAQPTVVARAQAGADAGRLMAEVTDFERRAADPTLTVEERHGAADKAIERRARLIDVVGSDPRRITWLIDQAAGVLARLSRDATDTTVLYAVPSAEQQERARATAAEADALLDRARHAASSITERETRLSLREGGGEGGEGSGSLLAALRDEQVRGAFVRGRARVLLAATAPDETARRTHAQVAIDALGGILMEEPAAEAARRSNLGVALLLRAEEGDARASLANFDFASGESRTGRAGVLPGTVAEALLGRLRAAPAAEVDACVRDLAKTRDRAPRVSRNRPDALWHVVFADAQARAFIERWRATGERVLLARAFEPHRALLDGTPDLGMSSRERRALIWSRLDRLVAFVGAPLPLETLPPEPLLARAVTLARDPGTRPEAERIFAHLADRTDAATVRADALWEMCVLAQGAGDAERAAALTARFAREFQADPRAGDALAYAVHHARERFAATGPGSAPEARRAYLDALRIATSGFPHSPRIDQWRLERARLLLEPSPEQDRAAGLALLESISAQAPSAAEADALYERQQGAVIDDLRARLSAARRDGNVDDVRRLGGQIAAEARRAAAWAGSRARPSLDRFLADRADGQVESGKPDDAAGVYRDLIGRQAAVPGGPARLGLGLGRALLLAGDDERAFAALREAAAPFDAAEQSATRPEEYWHAWTLMLEVLAAREGNRAGALRVHVRRLEGIDPALGGEPWASRIRAAIESNAGGG